MSNCPDCNAILSTDASFCVKCGYSIKGYATNYVRQSAEDIVANSMTSMRLWEKLKSLITLYGMLLSVILFTGFTMKVYDNSSVEFGGTIVFCLVVVGFAIFAWKDYRNYLRPSIPEVGTSLKIALAAVSCVIFVKLYFMGLDAIGVPILKITKDYTRDNWPIWSVYLSIALLPGVFEELAFRGVIQGGLEKLMSVRESLFIQAACFSILHLLPAMFISHFVIGLLLGWVRIKTKNIYWCMLLHICWNANVIYNEIGF